MPSRISLALVMSATWVFLHGTIPAQAREVEAEIMGMSDLCGKMASAEPQQWPALAQRHGLRVASTQQVRDVLRNAILTQAVHGETLPTKAELKRFVDRDIAKYISAGSVLRREEGKLLPFISSNGALFTVTDRISKTKGLSGLVIRCKVQTTAWLSKRKLTSLVAKVAATQKANVRLKGEQAGTYYQVAAHGSARNTPRAKIPLRAEGFTVKGKAAQPPHVQILIEHRNIDPQ